MLPMLQRLSSEPTKKDAKGRICIRALILTPTRELAAQIGESMGIRTVAERVDSAEVLARLADIGIQYAQGHYIGSPQPVEILETLLTHGPKDIRLLAS